jgi:hypothetical protein
MSKSKMLKQSVATQYYFLKRLKYYFEVGDFKSIIHFLDHRMISAVETSVWHYLLVMLRANSRDLKLQPVTTSSDDIRFFISLPSEEILVKLTLDQKHVITSLIIFVSEEQMKYVNSKLIGNQLIESGIIYVSNFNNSGEIN